jgi:2-polyprenyl-6-methoxyphenol hydroxylase-like FAD-dependent oxidoreductase
MLQAGQEQPHKMPENIIIVGAGIAGLGCAMALAQEDRTITLLDRDPPPSTDMETAFEAWDRKGATQLRHSHVFLGCLVSLIRKKHPQLHRMLLRAGAREVGFAESLPLQLRDIYVAASGDEEMSFLFSRRTTLEYVMRAYVQTLPGVTFKTGVRVRGLAARQSGQALAVTGVQAESDSMPLQTLNADLVIDAGGRNSLLTDDLRSKGASIIEDRHPAGILYFTRHYRLKKGQAEPPRDNIPGAGDLGYIKFGVFAADNGHFSITLAVPEIETRLRVATPDPDVFDSICGQIPGMARWTDASRSEPVTKVFGMGNLHNVWRSYVADGNPQALNFFAVGDAAIRTNPLYGRGCSLSVMHAHILADILDRTSDPAERARHFEKESRLAIRPYWDAIVKQDQGAIRRARNEQRQDYRPRLKARLLRSFAEDAVGPATRRHLDVCRAIMKTFHMLETPTVWLRNPVVMAKVIWTWLMPKSTKASLYPPKLGPGRDELLATLGLA